MFRNMIICRSLRCHCYYGNIKSPAQITMKVRNKGSCISAVYKSPSFFLRIVSPVHIICNSHQSYPFCHLQNFFLLSDFTSNPVLSTAWRQNRMVCDVYLVSALFIGPGYINMYSLASHTHDTKQLVWKMKMTLIIPV